MRNRPDGVPSTTWRLPAILASALVLVHLAAIAFYVRIRKETLIMPMITGEKVGAGETAKGGGIVAFCVAFAIALAFAYVASGAWIPAPPAAAAAETPNW